MAAKESIRQTVARNVKRYRKERGLTQEKLAEMADISNTYIANIECGKTWVSDKTLEKISDALKAETYLFFIAPESKEPDEESRKLQESFQKADDVKNKICAHIQKIFDSEVKRIIAEGASAAQKR